MRSRKNPPKRSAAQSSRFTRSRRGTIAAIASTAALTFMGMVPAVAVAAETGVAFDGASGASQGEGSLPPELLGALDSGLQLSAATTPQSGDKGRVAASVDAATSQSDIGDGANDATDGGTDDGVSQDSGTTDGTGTEPGSDTGTNGADTDGNDAGTGDAPASGSGEGGNDGVETSQRPQSEQPQSGAKRAMRAAAAPAAAGAATVVVKASTNGQPTSVGDTYYGANTALTVGAKYELRTNATDPATVVPGASCEIVAATPGTCTINVEAQDANKAYYLVQTQAATGTYFTSRMNLNDPYTPNLNVFYPGLTPNLNTVKTVEMPKDQVSQGGSGIDGAITKSFGSVVNSTNNPVIGARCTAGLKIAFMLDVSGSMNESAGGTSRLALLKSAFTGTGGILESLAGTNNQIALFNFSANSAGTTTSGPNAWNRPTPVSVTTGTGGNLASLKSAVNALSASGNTNWDQALRVVSKANETHKYDVLVFVTDGAPNYILSGSFASGTFNSSGGTGVYGSQVTQRSVEAAIYSANSLKAQGTRIISYGIYQGTTGAYAAQDNLAAVSGPNKGSDFFIADVNALTTYLASLVSSLTCNVPVTVEKYVPGTSADSWVGKAAWPMSVTNSGGVGTLTAPASPNTDPTGVAGPWNLQFTAEGQTTSLTVSEGAQPGWQEAKPPEYVISNIVQGTGPTTLDLPSDGVIPGVQPGDTITVKFYNEEIITPSVEKNFVSVAQDPDNPDQYRVIYSVTVTGANAAKQYQLVDNPGFPSQVDVISGNAHQLQDLDGHATIGTDFPITAGQPFPNPAANLPKNGKHYYHVEWVVQLKGDITNVQNCSPNGEGNGFFNQVQLKVEGQTVDEDDACGPIDKSVIPRVEKSVVGTPTQGVDGKWTISYQVKVTLPTSTEDNPHQHSAAYNLVDTLHFGGGINVESANWTGPDGASGSFSGNSATLATGKVITPAARVDTYNVVVVTSINPANIVDNTTLCPPANQGGNGGFMNRVVLTSSGVERKAEACDVPVLSAPTVSKTAAASSRNADGSWKITYNVVVTNSSARDLFYTLNDTPASPPSGATWKDGENWVVTGPSEPAGTNGSATLNTGWNGASDKVMATGQVKAGKTHTFTMTRNLVLSPTMDLSTLECKEGGDETSGVWNSATVSNGVTSNGPSKACAEVLTPRLTVDKTVASVTQSDQSTWVVTYDVVVANRGTTGATFGIADVPNFGAGFTVTEGKWVGEVQPLPGPSANNISAGAEHDITYHYQVTSTFDPEVENPGLACETNGNQAGAFMNQVNVTASSGDVSDWACAEPAGPTITKVSLAPVQDPATGEWRIGYDLVVTAPMAEQAQKLTEVRYTLSDVAAALPTGVTGGTWTVVAPTLAAGEGSFVAESPTWNGTGTVGTGTLPVGKQHTVKVFRNVTVGSTTNPADLQCSQQPGGKGLWNTGTVTNGVNTSSDDACTSLNLPTLTLEKTIGTVTQQADGQWVIPYTVTVKNTSAVVGKYDLLDTLKFGTGIVVNTATWAGQSTGSFTLPAGTAQMATGAVIPANATHTYTVEVKATIGAGIWANPGKILSCPTDDDADGQVDSDRGAFMNSAALTYPKGTITRDACGEPSLPTVQKAVAGAIQDATDPDKWTVNYTVTVKGGAHGTFYDLSDTPSFAPGVTLVSGTASGPGTGGAAASITSGTNFVTAQALAAGATHTYQVSWIVSIPNPVAPENVQCVSATPGKGFFNTATMSVGGMEKDATACQPITNQAVPTVAKSVTSTEQGTDGKWTIKYDVAVSLPADAGASAKYNLVDTLKFGAGIAVDSATWAGQSTGSFTLPTGTAQLATGTAIAPGVTHTYTVTVRAHVTNLAFTEGNADCELVEGEDGTGFLNTATITSGGVSDTKTACSSPEKPAINKVGQTPVFDPATGQWTISYRATVSNASTSRALQYELTDTPPTLPAGVTLVGTWKAEAADTLTEGKVNQASPGTRAWIISKGTLPKETTYTFTISATVKVDAAAATFGDGCTPNEFGIKLPNALGLVSGGVNGNAEGCVTSPKTNLSVAKDFVSANQNASGKWVVVYNINVKNLTANPTLYNLGDTIAMGSGVTVSSASWSGETTGSFADGATTAALATNRAILGSAVHTYTVTVLANVAPEVWGDGAVPTCNVEEGVGNGSFLNMAALRWPGGSLEDDACGAPSQPSVVKTNVGASQNPADPTKWDVSYDITVTGSPDSDIYYDLADVPAFASGVVVNSGTWTQTAPSSSSASGAVGSGGTIVTNHKLPAGETHVYRVSFDVSITSPIAGEDAKCGEVPTEGKGFFNRATIVSGGVEQDSESCVPITELVRPSVAKTVESTVQNADGTWSVTYNVTVTLPTDEASNPKGLSAKYDLSDTLKFGEGVTVSGATWTGKSSGSFRSSGGVWSGTLANGVTITPAANVHTYTVVAKAAVNNVAFEGGSADCVLAEGEVGTGFLNRVALTSGESTDQSEACSAPAAPSATKQGQEPVQEDDGTWTVNYLVTVKNPSDLDLAFALTDSPAEFPRGVTLTPGTTWTVEALQEMPAGTTVVPVKPDRGDWEFASGRIAAGGEFAFLVSANLTIDVREVEGVPLPEVCETIGVGIPLTNQLGLVSGEFESDDPSCVAVPDPASWVLEKSASPATGSTVQPGSTVTYTLKVTNTGEINLFDAVVVDDLSKVLNNATLTTPLASGLVLDADAKTLTWDVPEVDAGESVTISYQVVVNKDAWKAQLKNVATPDTPGGTCEVGKCVTEHFTPEKPAGPLPITPSRPPLARTGAAIGGVLMAAVLAGGLGFVLVRRSRKDL